MTFNSLEKSSLSLSLSLSLSTLAFSVFLLSHLGNPTPPHVYKTHPSPRNVFKPIHTALLSSVLVFWPHSVFGQNHLYVRMLQTGIPLFRVKSKEFQSSLSAIRTMCHPVRTPICLLFHPSERRVFPSGRQTDKHHLSERHVSSVRTPTSYREASVPACSIRTFQQHVRTPISSRTVH
jgi:hypothetical protein